LVAVEPAYFIINDIFPIGKSEYPHIRVPAIRQKKKGLGMPEGIDRILAGIEILRKITTVDFLYPDSRAIGRIEYFCKIPGSA
jgi:hypothetical protein